ncbi:hypothetical protein [Vitreimonas flagellata]|uniref:hypothetical protein n=1 Tax=Vitreimonas flagellata TaxID=2560861 RepID=UPI0010757C77|nr:hypothetical protein [Vitreimonas flagellata]
MRFAFAALCLVVAACGETRAVRDEPQAARELSGRYVAASDTARYYTGDLSIERAGLMFSKGAILYTRTLEPRRGYDLTAQAGDSYAAIAVGTADLHVELRRVTDVTLREGAPSLCGDDRPEYAALVYEERATRVTVLVFTGEEPPSSAATQSRLCATFGFNAPHGARTQEGVVL